MPTQTLPLFVVMLCWSLTASRSTTAADNAAANYLFAILEFDGQIPDHVMLATTDDPDGGFATRLSIAQASYLSQPSVASALHRFDEASANIDCDWGRYADATWSDAHINDRLHRLARIALLRARSHYEAGEWIDGNRDVERVQIMARYMTLQARPFEHQCFMIENMAIGTSAAYVQRFPHKALADLSSRHRRLGRFSPMAKMLTSEAERISDITRKYENGQFSRQQLLSCIAPYLSTKDEVVFVGLSTERAARYLRGLSAFIDDVSNVMDCEPFEAEQRITQIYDQYAKDNLLVAMGCGDYVGEFRENAQGVCRGFMFGAVVDRLREGQNEFSNIDDPYGETSLVFRRENVGFTLVSVLMHHSQIDLRFGLAGSGLKQNQPSQTEANHPMQPSGEIGRFEVEEQPSPPADR